MDLVFKILSWPFRFVVINCVTVMLALAFCASFMVLCIPVMVSIWLAEKQGIHARIQDISESFGNLSFDLWWTIGKYGKMVGDKSIFRFFDDVA